MNVIYSPNLTLHDRLNPILAIDSHHLRCYTPHVRQGSKEDVAQIHTTPRAFKHLPALLLVRQKGRTKNGDFSNVRALRGMLNECNALTLKLSVRAGIEPNLINQTSLELSPEALTLSLSLLLIRDACVEANANLEVL